MNYPFLKEEKFGNRTQLSFKGRKAEIYVPEEYFGSNLARQIGENIECIGLIMFKADGKLHRISMPIKFLFGFSDKRKWKGKLGPELPAEEYIVFELGNGDAFCYDLNHIQSAEDIVFFISKMIEAGKIPKTVPYSDIMKLLLNAMISSKNIGLGVSGTAYEIFLAELCRNKNKPVEPFRYAINKNPKNLYDYKPIKTTKLAEYTSTFTGLMGEDSKHQIVAGVTFNREGRQEIESPMEKLVKL